MGRELAAAGYSFVTVTPETHRRRLANDAARGRAAATSARDVFGWSKPFASGVLPATWIALLRAADAIDESGDELRARAAFLGHGFRSEPDAATDLADLVAGDVTCLRLRDPRLYHLDMALAVLDDGTALVCEDALAKASVAAVEMHPSIRAVVRIPLTEALQFGANLVQVGNGIVMAADAPVTKRALKERGYDVRRVALDEFHLAGGSAACLTARVHRQEAVANEEPAPESRAA